MSPPGKLEQFWSLAPDDLMGQGRKTFANTLKYIYMTNSANFGNMFSMAGAALFLPFLPLLPKQILLNNFLYAERSLVVSNDHRARHYTRTTL